MDSEGWKVQETSRGMDQRKKWHGAGPKPKDWVGPELMLGGDWGLVGGGARTKDQVVVTSSRMNLDEGWNRLD